jgi:hypothetical protein
MPEQIIFPSYLTGVLGEAAELLRSIAEIEDFELVGTVHQLRQDNEAIIHGWVDDRYRYVRVNVPSQFRDDLIRAFDKRSRVRWTGELHRSGKAVELVNARSFSVEDGDDAHGSIPDA